MAGQAIIMHPHNVVHLWRRLNLLLSWNHAFKKFVITVYGRACATVTQVNLLGASISEQAVIFHAHATVVQRLKQGWLWVDSGPGNRPDHSGIPRVHGTRSMLTALWSIRSCKKLITSFDRTSLAHSACPMPCLTPWLLDLFLRPQVLCHSGTVWLGFFYPDYFLSRGCWEAIRVPCWVKCFKC